jgi:hypothetical protein
MKHIKQALAILTILIFSDSCSVPFGTSCKDYNETYTNISGISLAQDSRNLSFTFTNIGVEKNKPYLNTFVYSLDLEGKNLKNLALVQNLELPAEIDISKIQLNSDFTTKWLEDNSVILCDNRDQLLKIDSSGKKNVIADCNKFVEFIKSVPESHSNPEKILDYISSDGKYLLSDNKVLEISNGNISTIEVDNEYLKQFPEIKKIEIDLIPGTKNKVTLQITYNESTINYSIGEIDFSNFSIKNLKFVKNAVATGIESIIAERDGKVIYYRDNFRMDINDHFYLINLKNHVEETLNFAQSDDLKNYNHESFLIAPDLENFIYLEYLNNYGFNLNKIDLNGKNQKVILNKDSLPAGDKIQYRRCSQYIL